MRLIIDIEQDGERSKCSTSTPAECIVGEVFEMAGNPEKRDSDKKKIAVNLVAMACGLHGNPKELFAHFNLVMDRANRTTKDL